MAAAGSHVASKMFFRLKSENELVRPRSLWDEIKFQILRQAHCEVKVFPCIPCYFDNQSTQVKLALPGHLNSSNSAQSTSKWEIYATRMTRMGEDGYIMVYIYIYIYILSYNIYIYLQYCNYIHISYIRYI